MEDQTLIILAFFMLIGQIIIMKIYESGSLKKLQFKFDLSNMKAENKIKLRKLEKDLGLSKARDIQPTEHSTISGLGSVLNVLKGLSPDQIGELADRFLGGEIAEEGSQLDGLINFAEKNPELVSSFIEGLGQKATSSPKIVFED